MNKQLEQEFDDGEILLEKKDVFMYNVPVDTTHRFGYYRASDWDVTNPIGTCTLIMAAAGNCCHIQLEDRRDNIVGQSVVEFYPGRRGNLSALSPVADSSRYFTLKLQQYSGGNDFIGLGFVSHKDSADVTKTLENFFAYLQNQLMKAVVEVPVQQSVSVSTVETRIKMEVVDNKCNKKVPNVIFKLENGHKLEGNLTNLNIEYNGSGSGHPHSAMLNPDSKTANSDIVVKRCTRNGNGQKAKPQMVEIRLGVSTKLLFLG